MLVYALDNAKRNLHQREDQGLQVRMPIRSHSLGVAGRRQDQRPEIDRMDDLPVVHLLERVLLAKRGSMFR
jgi:hypothetical protein